MRKKKSQTLTDAKKFYKLLLFEASGGNLGTKPELTVKNEGMTFAEKRGFLDSLIKISELERKAAESDEGESFFDKLKGKSNAGGTDWSGGNNGGAEGDIDVLPGDPEEESDNS